MFFDKYFLFFLVITKKRFFFAYRKTINTYRKTEIEQTNKMIFTKKVKVMRKALMSITLLVLSLSMVMGLLVGAFAAA